ncbi:hypothetical protein BJV74DRAFT_873885, partial [Russula compacta]
MTAQLLELQDEHIEVVLTAGKRTVISDAELHMLLDRREEDLKGRCAGWKSGAAGKDSKGDGINARAGTARAGGGDADDHRTKATMRLRISRRGPCRMTYCHFC